MLLTSDSRWKRSRAIEDLIIFKDGLVFRKSQGETGKVKFYQVLTLKQRLNRVLWYLLGEFSWHPGFTKTILAYQWKYYCPNTAELIRKCVTSNEKSISESRIDNNFTCPPLQNPTEHVTGPEDIMHVVLVPELSPSSGIENIAKATDVLSRYLCGPKMGRDAKLIASAVVNIMTEKNYLPIDHLRLEISFCIPDDKRSRICSGNWNYSRTCRE